MPPLEITFHGLPPSEALADEVRERFARLGRVAPGVIHCRVAIEVPHKHHHKGRHFRVRIALTVPRRGEVVVTSDPAERRTHEDPYLAVHEAFDALRRQLVDTKRASESSPRDR
jgi:ribosome-associated translation inhibitor RaiA